MTKDVIEVQIKRVFPVPQGFAVFIGNKDRTFIIYVDQSVGTAIQMFLQNVPKERPLTHDLIVTMFQGLGVTVDRMLINALKNNTFYARLFLRMDNELGTKVVEIDCRPSDALALAIYQKCKVYCAKDVLAKVEDTTEVLKKIEEQVEESLPDESEDEDGEK